MHLKTLNPKPRPECPDFATIFSRHIGDLEKHEAKESAGGQVEEKNTYGTVASQDLNVVCFTLTYRGLRLGDRARRKAATRNNSVNCPQMGVLLM